jgi:hypothetical protein
MRVALLLASLAVSMVSGAAAQDIATLPETITIEFKVHLRDDEESPFSNEEFLVFHNEGLTEIAMGKSDAALDWLRIFLKTAPDSSDSRHLRALLRHP